MTGIKWIKLTTDMFEDEKIDFIESLPDRDTILIIWVKLLTLAGKSNTHGYILLTENIPYTLDMLAHKFRRPLNTVKLAMETFKGLGMIEITESGYYLSNWEKHQNVEGMDKIREQTKLRVQEYRKRKNQELIPEKSGETMEPCERYSNVTEIQNENGKNVTCNVTSNVTCNADVTPGNALDLDLEIDKDIYNNNIAAAAINKNNARIMRENEKPAAAAKFQKAEEFWRTNIGHVNPYIAREIKNSLELISEDLFIEYCKYALSQNAKAPLKYIKTIIDDNIKLNIHTVEQFKEYKNKQKNIHKNKQYSDNSKTPSHENFDRRQYTDADFEKYYINNFDE